MTELPPPPKSEPLDTKVAQLRALAGTVPVLGGVISEAITEFIPGQKAARLDDWFHALWERLEMLGAEVGELERRILTDEGSDLLEDAMVEAARSFSEKRRTRLANLLARGLTDEDLRHDELKVLLRVFRDLTDSELILLHFYSQAEGEGMGSERLKELYARYPEVLRPASAELGSPPEEVRRGTIQRAHREALIQRGLLEQRGRTHQLTSLGRLLAEHISDD